MALPGLLPQQDEDDPLAMPNVAPEVTRDTTDAPGGGGSTPAPGLALQVVQPPEEVKRYEHTGEQKTTTEKVVHPEIEKAEAKIDDAIAARERAAIKEQEAKTRISEVEQKAAQEKVDRMRLAQLEKEQFERKHEDAVRAAVAEQEKRRADLSIAEAGKKRGYWDDRSAGERVLKAFAVGLSTYAHVRGGGQGPGPAYQVLQDEIARDRQAKLDKLDAAEKAYARSGQVVAGIDDAFAKRRQRIDDEASANMNWAEAGWGAIAKGYGTEQAKAAFEQARADLAIKRQQDREQLYKDKDREIRTAGERSDFSRTQNIGGGTTKQGPDLTALDANGNVYGRWRTLQEAEKGRPAQTALTGLGDALKKLNAHLIEHGKLIDPSTKEYADRQALGGDVSRYLQTLNDAGVLNPSEFTRNMKSVNTTLFKGGEAAAHANDLLLQGATSAYNARLKGQAVKIEAGAPAPTAAKPAAKPETKTPPPVADLTPREAAAKAAALAAALKADPKNPRAAEARKRIAELTELAKKGKRK